MDSNNTVMGRENLVAWGQSWATGGEEDCEGGPNEFPECTDETVINEVNIFKMSEKVPRGTIGHSAGFPSLGNKS